MKRCIKIILFITLALSFPLSFNASPLEEIETDFNDLYNSIPEEIQISEASDLNSALSFENIIKQFSESLVNSFLKFKPEYLGLLMISMIVFVYESLCKSFSGKVFEVSNIAILLILGLLLFEIVNGIISSFTERHLSISGYVSAVSAVSVSALISSANGASATALGTVCTVLTSIYNFICSSIIFPYANIYLSLALCGGMTSDFNLRRTSSFVRNLSIGLVGGVLALFSGIMSVQTAVSMTEDSLLKRTVKQILSSGLPVLGGAVSDGIDTLFTSATGIKNQVGMLGITVTVLMSLAPLSELLICFAVLSLMGFLFSFFDGVVFLDFINTARDVISVLICISLSLTIMVVLLFYFIMRVA